MNARLIPGLALLLLGAACNKAPAPPVEVQAPVDPVLVVVAVAKSIEAMPEKMDSILAANNFTEDSYRLRIREIAADSTLSARYTVAWQ